MANNYKLRQRVGVRNTVKNVMMYGSLGMITGIIVCATVLFFGNTFNSEKALANQTQATVSLSQNICPGDSVRLEATGGDVYRWIPANGLNNERVAMPNASPKNSTTYTVRVYKKTKALLRQSNNYALTSAVLNNRDKTLHKFETDVNSHQAYLITLKAGTMGFLDKAMLQVRVNNKTIGTCEINNRNTRPFEIVWENKNEEHAAVTLHLLNYDGDCEMIACNAFNIDALDKTELTTEVTVNKDCNSCPAPAKPQVINVNTKEVKLQWTNLKEPVLVRYKKTDDDEWKQLMSKSHSVMLSNLSSEYDYEVQAATICKNDTSNWTSYIVLHASDRQMMSSR